MDIGGSGEEVRLVTASSLTPATLTEVFNLGFSGYLVPMRMDEDTMREHLAVNDIDLERSLVAVDGQPVGVVLTGLAGRRPGSGGWALRPPIAARASARGC